MNKQSFLPINNHYSTIDISTLKSNNFKVTTLKREGIEKSSIIEIAKYRDKNFKNNRFRLFLLLLGKLELLGDLETLLLELLILFSFLFTLKKFKLKFSRIK